MAEIEGYESGKEDTGVTPQQSAKELSKAKLTTPWRRGDFQHKTGSKQETSNKSGSSCHNIRDYI